MADSENEFGASATIDALLVALNALSRFRVGGGRHEQRIIAIFDAIWLALRRSDEAFLDELESSAIAYARKRDSSERWGPHESWGDNATKVRSLLRETKEDLARLSDAKDKARAADNFATRLRIRIEQAFPELEISKYGKPKRAALQAALIGLSGTHADSPARLIERALVAAGMSPKDAHQRFAFQRVANSRATHARLTKARANR